MLLKYQRKKISRKSDHETRAKIIKIAEGKGQGSKRGQGFAF